MHGCRLASMTAEDACVGFVAGKAPAAMQRRVGKKRGSVVLANLGHAA